MDEASGMILDSQGSNDASPFPSLGSASGKIDGARDFEASSVERASIADNADMSVGDIDFTWAIWVNLESKTTHRCVFEKGVDQLPGGGVDMEYRLHYDVTADRFIFTVANNSAGASVNANNLGSPSTATWYFIVCEHDSVANELRIKVNDGTADTASWSGGSWDSGGFFFFGMQYYTAVEANWIPFDGLMDEALFWKRILTSGEHTELWNNGDGFPHPFTTAARQQQLALMGCGV